MNLGKNILITRAAKNAASLKQHLENQGFSCDCTALFDVTYAVITEQNYLKNSAIIITSSNAIPAVLAAKTPKDQKIFCVGKVTANKLRNSGFCEIKVADEENAKSLLEIIKQDSTYDHFYYFHGSIITLDFAKELPNVTKIFAYSTKELSDFSPNFYHNIANKKYDDVLIFSSHSAKLFINMLTRHNLLAYFTHSNLVCLSENICKDVRKICEANNHKGLPTFASISNFASSSTLKKFYERN